MSTEREAEASTPETGQSVKELTVKVRESGPESAEVNQDGASRLASLVQSRSTRVVGRPFQKGNKPLAPWKPGQSGNPAGKPKDLWNPERMLKALRRRGPKALRALDVALAAIGTAVGEDGEIDPSRVDPKLLKAALSAANIVFEKGHGLGDTKKVELSVKQGPANLDRWRPCHFAVADRLEGMVDSGQEFEGEAELLEAMLREARGEREVEAVRVEAVSADSPGSAE